MEINGITSEIIGSAMRAHTALGPGLLEKAYEACLLHELRKRGLRVSSQVELPVVYDGIRIDVGFRIDLLVEDLVIVELKACEAITPVFEAQLLSYLKLSGHPVGLLINFHVRHLRDGIKRFVEGKGWEKPLRTSVPSVVAT
jgi:GxxExxY protein